jgi:hypothetical protein
LSGLVPGRASLREREGREGDGGDPAVDDPDVHALTGAEQPQRTRVEGVGVEGDLGAVVEEHRARPGVRVEDPHCRLHDDQPSP